MMNQLNAYQPASPVWASRVSTAGESRLDPTTVACPGWLRQVTVRRLLASTWLVATGLVPGTTVQSAETTRVNVDSAGSQGNNYSSLGGISADGRYVAFASSATNLVPDDTNDRVDVFVHDRAIGQTSRISVHSAGTQGNGSSGGLPSLSAYGRYVAFESAASNLVPGDTNGEKDVFVHDRTTGQTTRVSVDSAGRQTNNGSDETSISADGRYVSFASAASNLVPGDTNGEEDVFVHDRATGQTIRVSVDSANRQGNGGSDEPSLSADGRYVVFSSPASNLVPDDTNRHTDVFVHDRMTGRTTRVSVNSFGIAGLANSHAGSLSADGRYVAYASDSINMAPSPGDSNGESDVFVHDRNTGLTTRVSVDSAGRQADNLSTEPSLSADGRYVAFASFASNLVPGDTNGDQDAFVHDRDTGRTTRVSVDSAGRQSRGHTPGQLSLTADGGTVAFTSDADDLVPGDTNRVWDVFVHGEPADPVDPAEPNDTPGDATELTNPWTHLHARCTGRWLGGWDLARQCEGIFDDYASLRPGPPLASADIWQFSLGGSRLDTPTDGDYFRRRLPDPSRYAGSNDVRPEWQRLGGGAPEPMPECGQIERWSMDIDGHATPVFVTLTGRLQATIVPDRPVDPTGEALAILPDESSPALATRTGLPLSVSVYCPRTVSGVEEALIAVGARATPRPPAEIGGYTLELDYIIEARRGVPAWILDLAEEAGMKSVIGLPCAMAGKSFPDCGLPSIPQREFVHPVSPRFPDCIADGPGCWEPLLVTLNEHLELLDLVFHAHPNTRFELYDSQQNLIAEAEPFAEAKSNDGQLQVSSRLFAKELEAGHYVLLVDGPAGRYAIDYQPDANQFKQ